MKLSKKGRLLLIPLVVVVVLTGALLRSDAWSFWAFYLCTLILGIVCMPICRKVFSQFDDQGWCFSKAFSILLTGYVVWLLVSCHILLFTTQTCLLITLLLAALCMVVGGFKENVRNILPAGHLDLILSEELLFLTFFLVWSFLAGFNPAANGTEKYMDYGFMEAMMRSTTLPAQDLWYSQGPINYYYGGQYYAVFMTKLTGTRVEITYNLFRAFVAGFAFVLPFSLAYQMITNQLKARNAKRIVLPSVAGGLTAGMAVSIAGNMHYVIYALVIPTLNALKGIEGTASYWFPDATRYIGYNPDLPDKTIHEFPCYSFVLGDLHAHVVNIMFVLLLLGILNAWISQGRNVTNEGHGITFVLKELRLPHILLMALLLGVFRWTNYWDFVIYFVVASITVLFTNMVRFHGSVRKVIAATITSAIEMAVVSSVVILPFTLQFVSMVQGAAFAVNHSLLYQLAVLWGLPTALTALLVFVIIMDARSNAHEKGLFALFQVSTSPDLFAVIMGCCAVGLVIVPEIVYARDIYGLDFARANTMFKLTYQAYMMFGITMGYGIFRLLVLAKRLFFKVAASVALILLILTVGYFGVAAKTWFPGSPNPSQYRGLDALAYLEETLPEDAAAIRWLKENVEDHPVVLEANGDSYTTYERVSASTGLPTILGWYAHEWLWRNDTSDLNQKASDIEAIYTSQDEWQVRSLLSTYDVSYIFVGSKETEKYAERLNRDLLYRLGAVVFEDPASGTFIVKV